MAFLGLPPPGMPPPKRRPCCCAVCRVCWRRRQASCGSDMMAKGFCGLDCRTMKLGVAAVMMRRKDLGCSLVHGRRPEVVIGRLGWSCPSSYVRGKPGVLEDWTAHLLRVLICHCHLSCTVFSASLLLLSLLLRASPVVVWAVTTTDTTCTTKNAPLYRLGFVLQCRKSAGLTQTCKSSLVVRLRFNLP